MPYTQIAEPLRQEHNLVIHAPAIFKFIKVRSRGPKVYSYQRVVTPPKAPFIPLSGKISNAGSAPDPEPKFEFKWSERYNLKRLPKEEAEAIRKKLEAEGH
jgi:hypothetical protein